MLGRISCGLAMENLTEDGELVQLKLIEKSEASYKMLLLFTRFKCQNIC